MARGQRHLAGREALIRHAREAGGFLLDILFPRKCFGCDREGAWLCTDCLGTMPLRSAWTCPFCKEPGLKTCGDCGKEHALDGLVAACDYEHEPLQRLIQALKYQSASDAASGLDPLVKMFMDSQASAFRQDSEIVPVPLHKRRKAERGFNQSEIIAGCLARHGGFDMSSALIRNRHTRPQVGLEREDRLVNLMDAFELRDSVEIKNIILVDDVFTTGATMNECAYALKKGGAREVMGFVLARG